MTSRHRATPCHAGFTLVELMIVVAVMAVLAAIAWPSLQEAIQKSRRADGMSALANLMQAQERRRANFPLYRDAFEATETEAAWPTISPDQHYTLTLANVNANAYTARATARSTSPQSSDSRCQALEVVVAAGNIVYRSFASGGSANAAPDPCWVR